MGTECELADEDGGLIVSPGKGSHSFYRDSDGVAHMKPQAGTRNASAFCLLLFAGKFDAAKGEFHLGKYFINLAQCK